MMLPTHALGGMAVALPFALAYPELAGVALLAGFVGGVMPDLDLYAGHRKTLHYPVFYPVLATAAVGAAALTPTPVLVAGAFVLLGAAVHSVMDVFGGGLELYPWDATSDRAVFDHARGVWLAPRRWVRYDGSPEDLLLAGLLAAPLLAELEAALRGLVLAALVVAAVYTAVRRLLPDVAVWLLGGVLADRLSEGALARLPARYRAATGGRLAGPPR